MIRKSSSEVFAIILMLCVFFALLDADTMMVNITQYKNRVRDIADSMASRAQIDMIGYIDDGYTASDGSTLENQSNYTVDEERTNLTKLMSDLGHEYNLKDSDTELTLNNFVVDGAKGDDGMFILVTVQYNIDFAQTSNNQNSFFMKFVHVKIPIKQSAVRTIEYPAVYK